MPPQQQPPQQPSIIREPMRWLFIAHLADGTTIEQTEEDKSLTRTDGTGSAFTDVLQQEIDGNEIVAFELVNGDEIVTVDLKTGAFIVNGTPLHAHNQYFEPQNYKLKLVYFRETRVDTLRNGMNEIVYPKHYINRYFIGWQCDVQGKNKQVTLAVG